MEFFFSQVEFFKWVAKQLIELNKKAEATMATLDEIKESGGGGRGAGRNQDRSGGSGGRDPKAEGPASGGITRYPSAARRPRG